MYALSAPKLYGPSEQQQAAIDAAMLGLDSHDRGQLVMACGTGKTLTALRFAEARNAARVLVLLPNLALLAQTLREWQQQSHTPFQAIAVCSDPTVAPAADGAGPQQTVPVTTDLKKVTRLLTNHADRRTVVFATYQSGGKVAAAQAAGAPTFDLVFADESHRTAGRATAFQHVLNGDRIRARERLFLTATPRHCTDDTIASMDNQALYGPVLYSYGFGQAIETVFSPRTRSRSWASPTTTSAASWAKEPKSTSPATAWTAPSSPPPSPSSRRWTTTGPAGCSPFTVASTALNGSPRSSRLSPGGCRARTTAPS
jgi:predicted helicase